MPPPTPPTEACSPHADDALSCPDCGYNLTGICTEAQPIGRCPECGRGFRRERLKQFHQTRRTPSGASLVVSLVCFPLVLASMPVCFGCVGIVPNSTSSYFHTPIELVRTPAIIVPIFGAALFAGLIATQALPPLPAKATAIRRDRHRGQVMKYWLIFFVVEVLLAAAYLFVGCGVFVL